MSRKPRGTTSSWILAMEGVAKRLLAQTPASVDLLMSEERSVLEARLLTRNPPLEREAATKLKLSLNQLRSAYKKGLSLLKRVAETREAVEKNPQLLDRLPARLQFHGLEQEVDPRFIIGKRFLQKRPTPLKDVAAKLGLTEDQTRKIEREILTGFVVNYVQFGNFSL